MPKVPYKHPSTLLELRKILKNIFELLSACLGIVGGAIGIYSSNGDTRVIAVWILVILVSAILIFLVYPILKRRPAIVPDTNNVAAYTIRHATKDDLNVIAKLQESAYSAEDAVPIGLYKEWYAANSEGFFVLEISGVEDAIVGHLTFLAIKDERLELYKKGLIRETEIRGCDLIGPENKNMIENIYIESVIVKRSHRRNGTPCLYRMLKSMTCSFCDPGIAKWVYAMAATDEGVMALKGMGFSILENSTNALRADGHDMFAAEFDHFIDVAEKKEIQYESKLLRRKPDKA